MSPLEVRRRFKELLDGLQDSTPHTETLRAQRALEALEHGNSAEGKEALERLAQGPAEARLAREARAALQRLATRSAGK